MNSDRLLRAPRNILHAIDRAGTAWGFRMGLSNCSKGSQTNPVFYLVISDSSAGGVKFTFLNTVPEAYAITHVYFDDGELMAIDLAMETAGERKPAPSREMQPEAGGNAGRDKPQQDWPIGVIFDLPDGRDMADIICALKEGRLKVSLKAARQHTDAREIFVGEPALTLTLPASGLQHA